MEFKSYIEKYSNRIIFINSLFKAKDLFLSYDGLNSNSKKVDHELMYFKSKENPAEESGLFIFGFDFFISDLSEQEFKKVVGQNVLNYKIYSAYHKLKKTQKKIKVTDILNKIQDKRKDSGKINVILRRILILAYYLNWDLIKDKTDLEGDSFIKIPENYLNKLKQRFDFNVITKVFEDETSFMFLNSRGKLNLVFKDLDFFSKKDIEKLVPKIFKKVFGTNNITFD